MKKSVKLGTLITCATTFLASVALSVGFSLKPTVKTHAETVSGVFEMESGASVKVTPNSDGLRFKAKMSKDYYDLLVANDENDDVLIYGYIAPANVLEGLDGNYADLINGTMARVGGELDESKIYIQEDGYYWVNVAMTGLANQNFQDKSFSCIVFIEDNRDDTMYIYADMAKDETGVENFDAQNRTQHEVINAAFLDASEAYHSALLQNYGSWFGTEDYPIIISTIQQYEGLVDKMQEDASFADDMVNKYVRISYAVGTEADKKPVQEQITNFIGTQTVKNAYVVKFLDGNRLLKTEYVVEGGDASAPANPSRDGYAFGGWNGNYTGITADTEIYAKWTPKKDTKDLGDITVYGVSLPGGSEISTEADVLDKKVVLASGYLGDGAYYPNPSEGDNNPTDKNKTADQSYLAYDGNYSFNDYFVADFTGKNMPTLAFFAKDYDNSVFYANGNKQGVVVSTGFTWPDGRLFTQDNVSYCTSAFNGKGLCMWGPKMIYSTAKNHNEKGVLLHANVEDIPLGRANLVDGTKYRVIMGFQPSTNNGAIKLVYMLYDLSNGTVVGMGEYETYGFFTGSNAAVGNMGIDDLVGSIVAYGYFGTKTTLDKVYDIYEDTTVDAIAKSLGMNVTKAYKSTANGNAITLGAGNLGDGANYTIGQNNGGYVDQAYYAFDGEYGLNNYVAFDFTGKNMPEVAFFAKNYNNSMYAEGTSKQGIVVVTGITDYTGENTIQVNSDKPTGKVINYDFPYMIQSASNGGFCQGAHAESKLGRENLVDNTHYRVIMGFTGSGNMITLHWYLYNLDTNTVVEQSSMTTWGFFSGSNAAVGNMTINDLVGSIVLYGKFGTSCVIDNFHGIFEASSIDELAERFSNEEYTVTFQNYDGTVLESKTYLAGETPEYTGDFPVRPGDAIHSSYVSAGWDKDLAVVTENVTYTATFTGTLRDDVTISGNSGHTYGVEFGNTIKLKKSNLGDGANYTKGQQNADGAFVHQSYLALDGNYALNDYVAFDFTGKNMPEVAFFAKNYNDSMYAEGTSKQGIVVVTGITTYDGQLTSGVNGNGTQINYGHPYMIQDASSGGFCQGAFANSALGRANLVDNTHYRVIMGFTGSGSAITLHWYLYNLDTNTVVEQSSMTTWNFFTGSNEAVGKMTINDLAGSIVLYGKFGVDCVIDNIYGVFEDTDIATIANGLLNKPAYSVRFIDSNGEVLQQENLAYGTMPTFKGKLPSKENMLYNYVATGFGKLSLVTGNKDYTLQYETVLKQGYKVNNVTASGDAITLNKGSIGDGANYTIGQNNGGYVQQSYFAFDGNYTLNSYIAFDFTGKNMPEVAFFAKNYNDSMYAEGTSKQGIVVVTGITTWDGQLTSGVNGNGTQINYGHPYMIQDAASGGFVNGAFASSALGRANLVDGKHYRVIMGFSGSGAAITLHWYLHDLDSDALVEMSSMTTWNFFTGSNEAVGNMTINDLVGSIVLYGKFGVDCTIDKLHGVYENATLEEVAKALLDTEGGDSGNEPETTLDMLGYDKYTDQFDFYAYSSYSDGTYEIDGQTYYIGKNLANLKQYSLYGEAGLTIYFPQSDCVVDGTAESIAKAKALIDDLAEVGIKKTILQDSRILYMSMCEGALPAEYDTDEEMDAYIYNCIKDYADYEGVYGIQLGDEPKYSMLTAYAAVYKSLKRVSDKYGYDLHIQYNLNPLNVTQEVYDNYYPETSGTYEWKNYRYTLKIRDRFTDCVARYTQYINDFLDAMQPDSIMYDDYPLMEDKNGNLVVSDSYIPCLQIVAKVAADRGIKFYNVTQAFENNADGTLHRRAMTEAGAKWLNNILLGFGAKQIAYYTYYTREQSDSTGGESYVDGGSFVDYNGNPTALYGVMQNVMSNNQKFAPTVLQFNYKGSKIFGSTSASHLKEITVSNSFAKLSACSVNTGSALVTELYDSANAQYMYMAMNVLDPDTAGANTVSMTFSGYTRVLVYDGNGNFTNVALSGGVYSATLNAGEAVFVIPYN